MSGTKLVAKQAFGINPNAKNCLSFSEDHHIAYICGHQVVITNTESKEQKFIPATSTYQHQSQGITAVTCSVGRKFIAVAERVDPCAIVTFYDTVHLKKKKVLTFAELGSTEIKCLAFSDDGRFLLTQGGGPEWNLVLWNVEKSVKVLSFTKVSLSDETPVHQVSFCPSDPSIIVVIGKSILRLFRYVEGQLRPITLAVRNYQSNFVSHCWLPDDIIIIGSESGEITLIENLEYRGVVYPTAADINDEPTPASCVSASPRGFVVGTYGGDIKSFERNDEVKEKYQLEDTVRIAGERGNITAFALGPDENLVIATDKNQLLSTPLTNLTKDGNPVFDNILTPFHVPNSRGECAITGIDVAMWKQVVVTCAKDRTVRVWNPTDRKLELMTEFEDDPLSLSVHPSGLYIAVAFSDKIRILSLLLEEIYLVREISARQCSLVKFSVGGHYLAAAVGSNLQVRLFVDCCSHYCMS
jgi:WD40 repeat protein